MTDENPLEKQHARRRRFNGIALAICLPLIAVLVFVYWAPLTSEYDGPLSDLFVKPIPMLVRLGAVILIPLLLALLIAGALAGDRFKKLTKDSVETASPEEDTALAAQETQKQASAITRASEDVTSALEIMTDALEKTQVEDDGDGQAED